MRDQFKGYYAPNDAEFLKLWNSGTIIIDTNVLLNIYRLPPTARNEMLDVLLSLKERLWIPHHVALEFQRNRTVVIAEQRKKVGTVLTRIGDKISEVRNDVISIEIEKHGIDISEAQLLSKIQEAGDLISSGITKAAASYSEVASADPIRDKIDEIFSNRVGIGPADQEAITQLTKQGEIRFERKIAPGYKDSDKDRHPDGPKFYFGNLEYERKFGDLILWRQIMEHAKQSNLKYVMLITADAKEDWWWRENGKTLGPQPSLIAEIFEQSNVDVFWMYSVVQFLEHAKKNLDAAISEQSVAEFVDLNTQNENKEGIPEQQAGFDSDDLQRVDTDFIASNQYENQRVVGEWLRQHYPDIKANSGFPDFISEIEDESGFEVKFLRNFREMLFPPSVVNSLLRGYMEVSEGRLGSFNLILVISDNDRRYIIGLNKLAELQRRVLQLKQKYPIKSLIIGSISDGLFKPIQIGF